MNTTTPPQAVNRENLGEAMVEVLGLIVELSPAIICMVSEVPPERWTSGWTRFVAQLATVLGASWAATVLGDHARWLATVRETDRAFWTELAICRPCPMMGPLKEPPPWEL